MGAFVWLTRHSTWRRRALSAELMSRATYARTAYIILLLDTTTEATDKKVLI